MATILMVDDDADLRMVLRIFLQRSGYTVIEARNGLQGLEYARRHAPDLILTDLAMPLMDGMTMVQHIQREPELRPTPIIVFTAYTLNGQAEAAREVGATTVLPKPTSVMRVLATITELLQSRLTNPSRSGLAA